METEYHPLTGLMISDDWLMRVAGVEALPE
jgi:hypothetical protein